MKKVIGRDKEQKELMRAYRSSKPEFIALYGRMRVGKTFLIRNTFSSNDESFFFNVTGTKNGTIKQQIKNFTDALATSLWDGVPLEPQKDWRDTFKLLNELLIKLPPTRKIVLFFDEFSWMVTSKSLLLETLEYFWKHYWQNDSRIKLIICGSSTGWI